MTVAPLLPAAVCAWWAQEPPRLTVEQVLVVPELNRIEVRFSHEVEAKGVNLDRSNVTLSPETIEATQIIRPPGRSRALRLTYRGVLADIMKVSVTFRKLTFLEGSTVHTVENLKAQNTEGVEARRERLRRLVTQQPKTSSQKHILASGFVTTASGGTTGGADIALNPERRIPGLTTFVHIKKTSQEGGDARSFEGGARYRWGVSFQRALLRQLRAAATGGEMNRIQDEIQKRWWAGGVFEFAAKLEGMATTFDISNFVGETGFQALTRTKALGKTRKGYWRGFVAPVAFEGGQSLRAGDTALQNSGSAAGKALKEVDWIARYKTGLGTTLFFEDRDAAHLIRRVELDVNGVLRNLFLPEALYNKEARMVDRTGKGVRVYGQIDLKIYAGETEKGRYGIRLSYHRGSLPPAFARVKSFQFGLLWESTDDHHEP